MESSGCCSAAAIRRTILSERSTPAARRPRESIAFGSEFCGTDSRILGTPPMGRVAASVPSARTIARLTAASRTWCVAVLPWLSAGSRFRSRTCVQRE